MFERTFTVKYITLKKCFCYLSAKHSRSVDQGSAAKLTYGDNCYYFTVGGFLSNLKDTEIGINALYCKTLDFKEENVIFSLTSSLPGIKTLNVTPTTKDDYEMLEMVADTVQSSLLDQLRVVHNGQKIVIWISNSIHVIASVDGVEPVSPGRLDQLTEVVIKPAVPTKDPNKENKSHIWSINGFLNYIMSRKQVEKECILNKYKEICEPFLFRVHPIEQLPAHSDINIQTIFSVCAYKKTLPLNIIKGEHLLFVFHPIPEPKDINYFDGNTIAKPIVVRLCILDDSNVVDCSGSKYSDPLFINASIRDHFGLNIGSKVILCHISKLPKVNRIEICANKSELRDVKDKFKLYIAEHAKNEKLVINSDFVMTISDNIQVLLKFTPSNVMSCLVDSDFVRNYQLSVTELEIIGVQPKAAQNIDDVCLDCGNFRTIINSCVECLGMGYEGLLENILIVGKSGSGRTTLAKTYANAVSSAPMYIHEETISCKNIKGKSLDSLHKYFTNVFLRLIYYQPSVLILDDLHIICEKVPEGDQPTQESLQFNKNSEMLSNLLRLYTYNNFIQIVATSESTLKLNQHIFASRGLHLFKNIFTIGEFNKNDRTKFLKFGFSKRAGLEDLDFETISLKTEGFVAQDLVDFVDKCIFAACKEGNSMVNSVHCNTALKLSSSLSLRNVQLHSPGNRDFSDVGGLDNVKKVLVESMLWPVQYANIFGEAPLRLQSGLLLYGPPGTGKTILAGAAAKQCNLRLISIKGPELLSKYIGASEQAVRDVFQKAQSAKPCILFFDEFDSLAPRRGHDNTGVTDRVVNQFLTQLDGVEALTGVCVLAATSRPDLLDPALLRPGRLDRQILCPLPDEPARLAILRSLSKTLNFAEDVQLPAIAAATEGYSGADLQGILYTAQLTSVELLLNEEAREEFECTESEISQQHLTEALMTTRPSLTKEERFKYEKIYAKFQGGGEFSNMKSGKQKATLA